MSNENENQDKLDDLQNEGLKPLSEEDEQHITGGGFVVIGGKCPPGFHWNSTLGLCMSNETTDTSGYA